METGAGGHTHDRRWIRKDTGDGDTGDGDVGMDGQELGTWEWIGKYLGDRDTEVDGGDGEGGQGHRGHGMGEEGGGGKGHQGEEMD